MVAYKTLVGGRIIIGGYPPTQAENKMHSTLLVDIVVGEGAAVLKLFAGKDEALLSDALLVLDFQLDALDRVGGRDLKRDGCEDVSQRMFQCGEGKEE
jgi:hypothetical protein